ncbi:phosphatidylglycerol lysyltransferase domain-containing protein [Roseomonas xinghualingensis]|uniref:phosphatidylglycerol lysyltransferase domain-containing protein n=1 Tax=Roseomonas xinghualingensis TaxID=2986475 RepID=UPI0021F0FD55|nr:phosphatidylglycerol lysyltransferase domain-containing protein [Roseomonas sp. SXEYE001]MCV4206591.1 phosphatidylglycerol lysyltransferase domain-containing protein [Roseomonas sp. SXEYE001]
MNWALIRKHGPTVFGLILLVGALYVVQREFRSLSVEDVTRALEATSSRQLWVAAGWTLLAYGVLTIYDRLGSVYAGKPISYLRTSLASFCAYTLAHNLGFAAVSGAAVRYRFYAAWGLTPLEIAKVIAFTSLTFGLGGFALGGLVLVLEPSVLPGVGAGELVPEWVAQAVGVGMWCISGTYVVLSRVWPHFTLFGHKIDLPGFRMAVAQVVLASVDVAVTAAIFYALLPEAPGLTFWKFLGIYIAAYTAGLAASVPGGLGVFDGFILLSLEPYLPSAQVVGAVLLFRLYYYIVPLFLAGGLFAAFELSQRRPVMGAMQIETRVTGALEVPLLAGLTGLGGVVLLFVGALPALQADIARWGGEWAALASQFAASVVGSLLLVVSYGMLRRLAIAWWAGLFLLLNAIWILVVRGDPWWVAAAYFATALFLVIMRRAFYRDARLTGEPLTGSRVFSLAAGVICGLTLATVAYHGHYSDAAWWEVVFLADAPLPLRFAVGVSVVLMLYAAFRLLRPARIQAEEYDESSQARLAALGARLPAFADGVIFADGGRAGLAFRRLEGVWVAEGDPAGAAEARINVIWRFRDLCDAAGVAPAFAGVGRGMLQAYEQAGMAAVSMPDGMIMALSGDQDPQAVLRLLAAGAAAD